MKSKLILCGAISILALRSVAAIFYVDANGQNPLPPYVNWQTAATNLQNAIDASSPGDLILVTNGVYATGVASAGDGNNTRVVVTKAVVVQSVNGSAQTTIDGGNTMRCCYLTNGAALIGFTVMNGSSSGSGGGILCSSSSASIINCSIMNNTTGMGNPGGGGGVWGGSLSNCVLTGNNSNSANGGGANASTLTSCVISNNSAGTQYARGGGTFNCNLNSCRVQSNYAPTGGGVAGGEIRNCVIANNSGADGGGVFGGYGFIGQTYVRANCYNCVIVGNSVSQGHGDGAGGGVYGVSGWATLYNCVIYYNYQALSGYASNLYGSPTYNCCSPGAPAVAGISGDPMFVDRNGGDFHLQAASPCINSGNNSYVSGTNDMAANPRIVGGTVDIGAYEYQTPASILSYAWANQYGLPTDGSADWADLDGDGMSNYAEWIAGTNPTNAASLLQLVSLTNSASGVTVTWQSVNTRTYYLQRTTDLTQPFSSIQSNLTGQAAATSYTDKTIAANGSCYYRVGVQ